MKLNVTPDLCKSDKCNLECIEICPQNKKGIETIILKTGKAKIVEKNCIKCNKCVTICPFEAIVILDKTATIDFQKQNRRHKKKKTSEVFDIKEAEYKQMNNRTLG